MPTDDLIPKRSEKLVGDGAGNGELVEELVPDILRLLDSFDGEESLKHLFWEILSYDRVREPLPRTLLPPSASEIVSIFEVFAASDALTVVYAETQQLPAGWQLEQIASAARRHLSDCVVVLSYGAGWGVVYPDETTSPRIRFLPLPGPADQRAQTARALLALNAADASGETLSRFEQSERLATFFPGVMPNLTDVFDDFDRISRHRDPEVRALRPFLRAISVYPLLTSRQERGEDVWDATPTESQIRFQRERLVLHNLRLVVWMAYKVTRMGITLSDLVQEGTIGLMIAAQRFDFSRGNRFTTYAFYWVRQAMYRALHNQCNLIRWPVYVAPRLIQAAKTRDFGGLTAGEKPPLFVDDRLELVSFYETDPYVALIEHEIAGGVRRVTDELRPSLRHVLMCRFGLNDQEEQTLEAIGQKSGLTRERIRQIEAKALQKLNVYARRKELKPYYELSHWRVCNRYDDGTNGRYRAPLRDYVEAREGF